VTFGSGGRRSIQLSYERSHGGRNKPSSVPARAEEDHFSGTAVTDGLEQPTRDSNGAGNPSSPIWPCSGWGLPATPVTRRAVRSYRTFSPLPVPRECRTDRQLRAIGGMLSVALSVASRRPGVTRHPALWSSDFPRHLRPLDRRCRDPHSPPDHDDHLSDSTRPPRRHRPTTHRSTAHARSKCAQCSAQERTRTSTPFPAPDP
jgi:hypothetical protein